MSLRSKERKLSFDILSTVDDRSPSVHGDINHHISICRSQSDPISENGVASVDDKPSRRKRKHRNSKKKKSGPAELTPMDVITENNHTLQENMSCHDDSSRNLESSCSSNYSVAQTVVFCEEIRLPEDTVGSVSQVSMGELRQRSVIGGGSAAAAAASVDSSMGASRSQIGENGREEVNSTLKQSNESNCKLETAESLDWSRLMAEDPDYPLLIKKSPFKYLLEEMDRGNSLRCTTSSGNDKERERVYDTIFRLPWRCELLIDVGFYVCLNSFLSLLTIMPIRILVSMWRLLHERILPLFPAKLKREERRKLNEISGIWYLGFSIYLPDQTFFSPTVKTILFFF